MRYFLFTLALTALASSCVTASLGINCRGDDRCRSFEGRDKTTGKTDAMKLRDMVRDIKDDSIYKNRHLSGNIKCLPGEGSEGICAFLQSLPNNEGVTGKIIKELADRIVNKGCNVCGSVPVHPGNDGSTGQLTFNYISP